MDELIKIKDENGKQVVSARELYENLGLDLSNWKRWFEKNIIKNSFAIENQDYIVLVPMTSKTKDFALTIDFAKRLSMLARTPQGENARNYFINCENKLKSISTKELSRMDLIQMAMQSEQERLMLAEKVELQNRTIQIQAPKVKYVNEVLLSESTLTTTSIAKELGMAAPTLNKVLKERGIQYQHNGHWVLYNKFQNKGYTKTKTYTYTDSEGKQKTALQTVWTEKGREFLHMALNPSVN